MWKLVSESVAGVSHVKRGEPCQDFAGAKVVRRRGGEPVLVVACADGAGSAALGGEGARHACDEVLRRASLEVEGGLAVPAVDPGRMLGWYAAARGVVEAAAAAHGATDLRELACTLLVAVVGEAEAAFAQVGDGAIVVLEDGAEAGGDGDYKPVFWPQTGEYANTTNFLTGPDYEKKVAFAALDVAVDELALFTDGLQTLALRIAEHRAHGPFFAPLFRTLRAARGPDTEPLREPLRRFLDSPRVNERTEDDKTLVLATRLPRAAATAARG
jgi:hypothetical protein